MDVFKHVPFKKQFLLFLRFSARPLTVMFCTSLEKSSPK